MTPRKPLLLVNGANTVEIDFAAGIIKLDLVGFQKEQRFTEFKQLTPDFLAGWYRRLGYVEAPTQAKQPRPPQAGKRKERADRLPIERTCINEGCTKPGYNQSNGRRHAVCRDCFNAHRADLRRTREARKAAA